MRGCARRLALLALSTLALPSAVAGEPPLRIAVTPVLVEQRLGLSQRWVNYVGRQMGRPAHLLQRRSYSEISDLLEKGQVDVAFVCGLPYVLDHKKFGLELLVAPLVYDRPIYYSYVIVPSDSPVERLEQLRGKRYAFSDPLSNSGHLVPTYLLARMGQRPDAFFRRYIFTYSHSESVEAVAVRFVDGASVDSYVYDHLAVTNSRLVARTRVIHRSPAHGITPVVVRRDLDPDVKERMRGVFLGMEGTTEGKEILQRLMIKRFVRVQDDLYDSIRQMLRLVGHQAPRALANHERLLR